MESIFSDDQHQDAKAVLPQAGKGPQGIHKAPGQEMADDTDNIISVSQKGKKVDADPSVPADMPVKE